MIVRSWHGALPERFAAAFEPHFSSVVEEIKAVPGNLGVFYRMEIQGAYAHIFLLSYWDGWDAIHKFAGPVPHIAVTYPSDSQFELISDPLVMHQECTAIQPWYGEQ